VCQCRCEFRAFVNPDNKCRRIKDIVNYMMASSRLRPNNKLESEQERGFQIVTLHLTQRGARCAVGRRKEGEGGRGETWSWKMIDCHRHSRYHGTSTCIAVIVKSVWMRRRWPLSGSSKPEILDVLGAAARNATRRLISADKKKRSLCHDSLLWHRDSLNRILRRGRPTFDHLHQNCLVNVVLFFL